MRHTQSVKRRGRRLLPSIARDGGGDCAERAAPWAAAESAELSANQRSEFIFLERKGERDSGGGGGEEARAGNHRGVAGSERMGGTAAAGCLVCLLA